MEWLASLLANQSINWFVNTLPWVWPLSEVFHFVGMALLFGTIGLLDLRILGLAKGLPGAAVHRLVPWGIGGFGLCVATGYLFVAGSPGGPMDHLGNLAFQLKSLCLLLAGLNVATFYLTGVSHAVERLRPTESAPVSGKIIAAASLGLWLGVIYFGRMIMYADNFYLPEFYSFQ